MIIAFALSFILTLALTPFAIEACREKNILDYPKEKSIHTKPIPMLGGVVIFCAFFLISLIMKATENLLPLFISSLCLVISGIYDDLAGLNASRKLIIQFIAVYILIAFGISINKIRFPFGSETELGVLSPATTVIWFIFIINLINIIDGLDGLAAGLSAIVAFLLLGFTSSWAQAAQILILAGSLLAFLRFNFYPAGIFLGNNGSSLVGFLIAYFSLVTSQKTTVIPIMALPLCALLVHVFDVIYAVFRRTKSRVNIFKGDRQHMHYLLLDITKNHALTVLSFYLISLVLAVIMLRLVS